MSDTTPPIIHQQLSHVLTHIQQATVQANRPTNSVTLVAISKTRPIDDIVTAYEAGIRHFGENRTDELAKKVLALQHLDDIQWHFIGHLQTRQSKIVAQQAHYFHALDRLKIARRLSRQLQEQGHTLPTFIEVNVSGEASKGGFSCANWETDQAQREQFLDSVREIITLPCLDIRGLMTMAPYNAPETLVSSVFNRLHDLSTWLNTELLDLNAKELSMGMSGDFKLAIAAGATHVRVGSAIFKAT